MADQNQDEMYSDSPDEAPAAPKADSKEEGDQTGLLPKSFFGSKEIEPGKQCKIEIVKKYDDEIQVRYVAHKSDDAPEKETAEDDTVPDEADALYSDA